MDLDQLKKILDLVREHELAEFEIEHEGLRLKIRKDSAGTLMTVPVHTGVQPISPQPAATAPPVAQSAPAAVVAPVAEDNEIELAVVKSPIVGTFYRSAEPGAAAFVDIGSTVKKGQVLCIIAAMKLMNEIEAETAGEIVKVHQESGQPVQYGDPLFTIRPE